MIIGKNLKIRSIKDSDLGVLFDLLSDLESKGPFLPTAIKSEANFKREFETNGFISDESSSFALVDESAKIIGFVWVFKSVPYFDAMEIGYQIFDKTNRGKGNATEAVRLFVNYLFESSQVNRIEIRMAKENLASEKVAKNNGFTHEGTSRQAAYSRGKHYDMHLYSKLRAEWRS